MRTLVLGASPNPLRYSNKAVKRLLANDKEVVAIGKRETEIDDVKVLKGTPSLEDIHTVTLYLGPANQEDYLEYIVSLKPKRIIFNPGTYNKKLEEMAESNGIDCVEDCTLIMLDAGNY
ncbi:MAG: CoA-binding protein [Bacteroidia bacterium]|nr:MAG: CoA-binding protein [Bacteroidia bacterium]